MSQAQVLTCCWADETRVRDLAKTIRSKCAGDYQRRKPRLLYEARLQSHVLMMPNLLLRFEPNP